MHILNKLITKFYLVPCVEYSGSPFNFTLFPHYCTTAFEPISRWSWTWVKHNTETCRETIEVVRLHTELQEKFLVLIGWMSVETMLYNNTRTKTQLYGLKPGLALGSWCESQMASLRYWGVVSEIITLTRLIGKVCTPIGQNKNMTVCPLRVQSWAQVTVCIVVILQVLQIVPWCEYACEYVLSCAQYFWDCPKEPLLPCPQWRSINKYRNILKHVTNSEHICAV